MIWLDVVNSFEHMTGKQVRIELHLPVAPPRQRKSPCTTCAQGPIKF